MGGCEVTGVCVCVCDVTGVCGCDVTGVCVCVTLWGGGE